MATIIKFNEAEIENAVGGTVDLVASPVVNVEWDCVGDEEYITVYLEPKDGVTHYVTLTKADWEKVKKPTDVRHKDSNVYYLSRGFEMVNLEVTKGDVQLYLELIVNAISQEERKEHKSESYLGMLRANRDFLLKANGGGL